jgi:hypothetical protein
MVVGGRVVVNKMFIDEDGEYVLESDHVGMWVDIDMVPEHRRRAPPREKWKINQSTDWGAFRDEVEQACEELEEAWEANDRETQGGWNADSASREVTQLLWEVGLRQIGWQTGSWTEKREVPRGVREARGGRRVARQAWRRSVKIRAAEAEINRNRQILRDWQKKVAGKEGEERQRQVDKFMGQVGQEMDGTRRARNFWQYWRERVTVSEMPTSLRRGGQELKTEREMKQAIKEHFQGLNIPHGVGEGDLGNVQVEEAGLPGPPGEIMGEVEEGEVDRHIRALKNGKAIGVDRIPNEFLKQGGPKLQRVVRRILDGVVREESVPKQWREGQIVLLHKGGG